MEHLYGRTFYHIYPLGFCGAARYNDGVSAPADGAYGLRGIEDHIPRLRALGINALYIGPLFESMSHGYDTVDYFQVDRRLGTNASLRYLVDRLHENGIMVVLDAVFNHSGRGFFAFKDLVTKKVASEYTDWYVNIDFTQNNAHNDGFSYEGWAGHTSLVKLNTENPDCREHLLNAARFWIDEFDIDGLRLDAADVMNEGFLSALSGVCKQKKPHFWLMGEIVAGDYRRLAREGRLDSVTNYELFKSLWSSFNDKNFFELSWTLGREFAADGLYTDLNLYNFADNHDVNRVASTLKNSAHLFPLYGLLFTVPGIPSLYYGSEYGAGGIRDDWSDAALRPLWNEGWTRHEPAAALYREIARFAGIRARSPALREGTYRELFVAAEQFGFIREKDGEAVIVVVNAAPEKTQVALDRKKLPDGAARLTDLLSGETFTVETGGSGFPIYPAWLRILNIERG